MDQDTAQPAAETVSTPTEPMPGVGAEPGASEASQSWADQAAELMNLHPREGVELPKDEDDKPEEDGAETEEKPAKAKAKFINFPGQQLSTEGMTKGQRDYWQRMADEANGKQGDGDKFDHKLAQTKAELLEEITKLKAGRSEETEPGGYYDDIDEAGIEGLVSRDQIIKIAREISNEESQEKVAEALETVANRGSQLGFLMAQKYLSDLGITPEFVSQVKEMGGFIDTNRRLTTPPVETMNALTVAASQMGIEVDDPRGTAREFERALIDQADELKASGVDPSNPYHRMSLMGEFLKVFKKPANGANGKTVSNGESLPRVNGRNRVPLANDTQNGRSPRGGIESGTRPRPAPVSTFDLLTQR